MKSKFFSMALGIYDLVLALGFTYIGVMMISSKSGIFVEYPKEWLSKLPFISWTIPGIIFVLIFGLGNITAAMFSFRKANNKSWVLSAIMGIILFITLAAQVIILDKWYLATLEFFIFSLIQLSLSILLRYNIWRTNL